MIITLMRHQKKKKKESLLSKIIFGGTLVIEHELCLFGKQNIFIPSTNCYFFFFFLMLGSLSYEI